jgi:hypothetical protein
MSHHHHRHDGGPCGCEAHDHDDSPDRGAEFSLYRHVDIDRVRCLNELDADSIRSVFKPWDQRADRTKVCTCVRYNSVFYSINQVCRKRYR